MHFDVLHWSSCEGKLAEGFGLDSLVWGSPLKKFKGRIRFATLGENGRNMGLERRDERRLSPTVTATAGSVGGEGRRESRDSC